MICLLCKNKPICNTYSKLRKINHADISVSDCRFFINSKNNTDNNEIMLFKQIESEYKDSLSKPYSFIQRKDLNKNKKDSKNKKEQNKQLINCPSCKGTTYDNDLKICDKCGKTVCSSCGTQYEGKIFCPDCWKEE